MEVNENELLARVRCSALREVIVRGGRPTKSQVQRAVAPLGVYPLDAAAAAGAAGRARAALGLDLAAARSPAGSRRIRASTSIALEAGGAVVNSPVADRQSSGWITRADVGC